MRDISPELLKDMYAESGSRVFLTLLTIDHASLGTPFRFVDDLVGLTHGGETYTAFPFSAIWSNDDEDSTPSVKLVLDNVDNTLVQLLRSITEPPLATLEAVSKGSDIDIISEIGPFDMLIIGYSNMSSTSIELNLGFESYNERVSD